MNFANVHNQYQELLKKYGIVCDRAKTLEEERTNFKRLY